MKSSVEVEYDGRDSTARFAVTEYGIWGFQIVDRTMWARRGCRCKIVMRQCRFWYKVPASHKWLNRFLAPAAFAW